MLGRIFLTFEKRRKLRTVNATELWNLWLKTDNRYDEMATRVWRRRQELNRKCWWGKPSSKMATWKVRKEAGGINVLEQMPYWEALYRTQKVHCSENLRDIFLQKKKTKQRNNSENHNRNFHCSENLNFRIKLFISERTSLKINLCSD